MVKMVKIQGGLGNQLFQCAYADFLREYFNQEVYLETSWYTVKNFDTNRKFELSEIVNSFRVNYSRRMNSRIFQHANPHAYFLESKDNNYGSPPNAKYFLGYFQNKDFAGRVLKNLNSSALNKLSGSEYEKIAVHIRRGDYTGTVARNFHGICSINYFMNAVNRIVSILGELEVDVYSDDPEILNEVRHLGWNIKISGETPFDQMAEMSKYRGLVISNSSFSWWSAQFARDLNRTQLVVAPNVWLVNQSSLDSALKFHNWLIEEKT